MASRVIWKENHLVNIKLQDDLYTIGQMLISPYMMFFQISNSTSDWVDIDLNQIPQLFCGLIGNIVLQRCVVGKIKKGVIPATIRVPEFWIRPYVTYKREGLFKGGDLIKLDPKIGYYRAEAVKKNLSLPEDKEIISKYELVNMWGDGDLSERLIAFFKAGKDANPFKDKVFSV